MKKTVNRSEIFGSEVSVFVDKIEHGHVLGAVGLIIRTWVTTCNFSHKISVVSNASPLRLADSMHISSMH